MDVFNRGVQAYILALSLIGALAIVWGSNEFLLGNTAAGTGWPVLVAIAGVFVLLGTLVLHRRGTTDGEPALERYPW